MVRKTTASVKKTTKKKAPEKKSEPVSHKKDGGGLGVVIVLLVGILIIGALFIAIQNNKTTELENEVTILSGNLEGKIAELSENLATTKDEQEKQKEEVKKLSEQKYTSATGFFSFVYPTRYEVQLLTTDSFATVVGSPVQISKANAEGDDNAPYFTIYLFENENALTLEEWLSANSEENTEFTEETVYTEDIIAENSFLTYSVGEENVSTHYYVNTDTHIISVRTNPDIDSVEVVAAVQTIFQTLQF